jgi:hypothetical protein
MSSSRFSVGRSMQWGSCPASPRTSAVEDELQGASELLCLGKIGGGSSRFCIANKIQGYSHCGTKAHALNKLKTFKFVPQVNHFYPPRGEVAGKPTALIDPSVHINKVPCHLQARFSEGLLMSKQWVHEIIEAATHVPKMKFNTPKSRDSGALEDNEELEQEDFDNAGSGDEMDNRMEED